MAEPERCRYHGQYASTRIARDRARYVGSLLHKLEETQYERVGD